MADHDRQQLAHVASLIRKNPMPYMGLDFYTLPDGRGGRAPASHMFPELNHGDAIEYFFFMCMQNFGFWFGTDSGYEGALRGYIDEKSYKGSDLLTVALKKYMDAWPCYNRDEKDPRPASGSFDPCILEAMSWEGMTKMFQIDGGAIPFPDWEERYKLIRAYGAWFTSRKLHPKDILKEANEAREPLAAFMSITKEIPGYNRDPLLKKNFLLAMALAQRPERFLKVKDPYHWRPIVDYHLMRVALRLGIVSVSADEVETLSERAWCGEYLEESVRRATYRAVNSLLRRTGKTMFELDELLWSARRYCPEESEPDCEKCFFNSVCAKRINLFQPVMRTTNY